MRTRRAGLAKRDGDTDLSALLPRFTREDILGMLAYSAGILPENRPATMEALIGAFDWKNVKTEEDMRLPPSFNLPPVPLDMMDTIKDAAANDFHWRQRLFILIRS